MATATMSNPPPATQITPRRTWRQIWLTRTAIFSLVFLIVGAVLLISAANNYTAETITTFALGDFGTIPIPTQSALLLIGVLYVISGVVGIARQITDAPALRWPALILLLISGVLIIPTVLIVAAAGTSVNVVVVLAISVRTATPVVLGALAGIWCERSGVVNIGIEGMMLTGACFGFITYAVLASSMSVPQAQFIGVIVAIISGGVMSALHAWLSITFKTDQVVSGTVINILALGLTSFMRREVLQSLADAGRATLSPINIPLLSDIPIIGQILFQGRPIFYCMIVLLFVTHFVLYFTRWGLRTRAVGENPHAADTLGINVRRVRWINVIIGGMIAGLAGAWFSLETNGAFEDNTTSGRGFIALAAMIFGKWTPFGAAGGGLLYGFSDQLSNTFQGLNVPIPPQFVQSVPYIVTIIVVAGLVGRAVAPKADGVPYDKESK
jgi:general nucleoside transport system permease protein